MPDDPLVLNRAVDPIRFRELLLGMLRTGLLRHVKTLPATGVFAGEMVWNDTDKSTYAWTGTSWVKFATAAAPGPHTILSGTHTDTTGSPSSGHVLYYNGSFWVSRQLLHADISSVGSSDHHAKYTNAEAIAAIVAEDPLALLNSLTLGGDVLLRGGGVDGYLYVRNLADTSFGILIVGALAADVVAEVTPGAGVTIDSVPVKDGRVDGVDLSVGIGHVFITNATGAGTISNKTYEANTAPANKILTAFESDDNDITVHLEIHLNYDAWQPAYVTVSGGGATPVNAVKQDWTQVGNGQVWTATANLTDADTTGTITATIISGGDASTVSYTRSLDPPQVLTLIWDNQGDAADPYPAAQTQFKENDNMQVSGTTEAHADEVYIVDYEATSGEGLQGPYTVVAGAFTAANVKAGNGSGLQNLRAYAKVTGGSNGPNFTETTGTQHSQTVPTFSSVGYTYPVTQEALKDSETCDVSITHTNPAGGDTYLYDDNSTGELTIPATTTYAVSKTVTRLSGNYRESGTNYRLAVTRTTQNGASATQTGTVKIAHTTPVVTVASNSGGSPLNRMGTGDGTPTYKETTVYLISTQANLSSHTPTLAPDGGDTCAFTGSWATDGDLRYTRPFRVEDADINTGGQANNNFTWGACSLKNRAGKEATTVTTNTTYSIGGFQQRSLVMGPFPGSDPPYDHTADIGVAVVDTSKCTVVNTSKGGTPSQTYEGNVTEHNDPDPDNNNFWTTVAGLGSEVFDDYSQYFHCSDRLYYESVTAGTYTVTIVESET